MLFLINNNEKDGKAPREANKYNIKNENIL